MTLYLESSYGPVVGIQHEHGECRELCGAVPAISTVHYHRRLVLLYQLCYPHCPAQNKLHTHTHVDFDKLFICIVIVQVHMRGEVFHGHFVKWLDNSHAQLSGLTQNKILKNTHTHTHTHTTHKQWGVTAKSGIPYVMYRIVRIDYITKSGLCTRITHEV